MASAIAIVVVLAGGTIALGEMGIFDRKAPTNDAAAPNEDASVPEGPGDNGQPPTYSPNPNLCEVIRTDTLNAIAPLKSITLDQGLQLSDGRVACDVILGDQRDGGTEYLLQLDVTVTESLADAVRSYEMQYESATEPFVDQTGPMKQIAITRQVNAGSSNIEMIFQDGNMHGTVSVMIDAGVEAAVADTALLDFTTAIVQALA